MSSFTDLPAEVYPLAPDLQYNLVKRNGKMMISYPINDPLSKRTTHESPALVRTTGVYSWDPMDSLPPQPHIPPGPFVDTDEEKRIRKAQIRKQHEMDTPDLAPERAAKLQERQQKTKQLFECRKNSVPGIKEALAKKRKEWSGRRHEEKTEFYRDELRKAELLQRTRGKRPRQEDHEEYEDEAPGPSYKGDGAR